MTRRAVVAEQRREIRKPAEGEVWFALEAPGPVRFRGRLVDSSKSGFRASHSQISLCTGQRVRFRHSLGKGHALVMWNQIIGSHIESGFLILDRDKK
jgi:hypothetical protein